MNEDDILKDADDGLEAGVPLDDDPEKKKKDLLDDEVESIEDLAEEELEEEEPFDDLNPI